MNHLNSIEARHFAERWLPAWTGNDPDRLVDFYADDVFYLDPAIPAGITGKPALLAHLRKLLAYNPDWVWTQIEAIPLLDGFLNKWKASMPVGATMLEIYGVCTVQLNADGKIYRNEVYFDRSRLLPEIARLKQPVPHL